MENNGKTRLADAACLFVAVLWGIGFIAAQYAIDSGMSSSLIMALRFCVATLVMLLICAKKLKNIRPGDLIHGGTAGLFLFCGFYLQTYGQARTTVSNCAFITATNVVMVPFIVWAFTKAKPPLKTFVLAGTTLFGIGLLTLDFSGAASISAGDGYILLCAAFFATHIFYLGHAVKGRDALLITFIQLATAALVSAAVLLAFDREAVFSADYSSGLPPAFYLGLVSTCLCYMLQTWAQKYTAAPKAGILLSTEGLFGSLFSVLLGFDVFGARLLLGGGIILASVVLMELPANRASRQAGGLQ